MDIQNMLGREVDLFANGIIYRGELVEVSDESIFLKTPAQWIELPLSAVSNVRPADFMERRQEGEDEVAEEV